MTFEMFPKWALIALAIVLWAVVGRFIWRLYAEASTVRLRRWAEYSFVVLCGPFIWLWLARLGFGMIRIFNTHHDADEEGRK